MVLIIDAERMLKWSLVPQIAFTKDITELNTD